MAAAGVPDLEIPSLTEALAEFDAALAAEPEPESDNARWLREMGIS